MYCSGNSNPTISCCTIIENTAGSLGSGGGGGIYFSESSSGTVGNCSILNNAANAGAGLMSISVGGISIYNSTVARNTAWEVAGGMCFKTGPSAVHNCSIFGNNAAQGGGIQTYADATVELSSSVLWNNTAATGPQAAVIRNHTPSSLDVAYCDVEGGPNNVYIEPGCMLIWGPGNIDADPCFVDPNGPDGDPNTWEDNDYHLSPNSPCIDAGDPNGDYAGQTDIDGQDRTNGVVDMGSDEVWPDVDYALTLDVRNDGMGYVEIDPEPNDANQPVYAAGTVVTLLGVPNDGKKLDHWEIYDPNHPGDANYLAIDSNNPIIVVMDADRDVTAAFKCGSGAGPLLPMTLGALGLSMWTRRRR